MPADHVTVEVNGSHACGQVNGTVHVRLAADLPDDDLNQEVSIGFYRAPAGLTSELGCTVEWDREPLPGLEYTRDSTSTTFAPQRRAEAGNVQLTVEKMVRQAQVQRALNAQLNDPQSTAKLTSTYAHRSPWYDILQVDAQVTDAGTSFVITDRRGSRGSSKLTLDVDDAGQIVEGWVDTSYGTMHLAGLNLDRAVTRLEHELRWATETRPDDEPMVQHVQDRLRTVLAAAR